MYSNPPNSNMYSNMYKTSKQLPPNWSKHSDNGRTYYYNDKTNKSQWEKPKSFEELLEERNFLIETIKHELNIY